jgi:ketosteroid isomerase-like protein
VIAGASAIRANLEQSVKLGIRDLRHIDREVYGNGSTVVEITQSVAYDKAGKELVTLRYMTLWQKAEGRWRIHREFAIPIVVSVELLKAGQKAR